MASRSNGLSRVNECDRQTTSDTIRQTDKQIALHGRCVAISGIACSTRRIPPTNSYLVNRLYIFSVGIQIALLSIGFNDTAKLQCISLHTASTFNAVVRWRKLGEVENSGTSHNVSCFAIFMPKTIQVFGQILSRGAQKHGLGLY